MMFHVHVQVHIHVKGEVGMSKWVVMIHNREDILFDEVQLLGNSNEYAKKQSFPVESTK